MDPHPRRDVTIGHYQALLSAMGRSRGGIRLVHLAGTLHSRVPVPWGKPKNLPISPTQTESRLPAGCAGTPAQ